MFHRSVASIALAVAFSFGSASAQPTLQEEPRVEWEKRQDVDARLRSYGVDLLGDQIDPNSGTLVFEHTDVSLPGNSGLDVSLRRRLSQGFLYGENVDAEFGDWEYVVPRIVVVSSSSGWVNGRCSLPFRDSLPPVPAGRLRLTTNNEYSQGVSMQIPGQGAQQVLETPQGSHWPSGRSHVTAQGWYLTCIPNIGAGNGGGEGFYAYAPNGDRYKFDRYILHQHTRTGSVAKGKLRGIDRVKNILAATEVRDVNGNTVDYTYDTSGRLTRIKSTDGRQIDLTYTGSSKLVQKVESNRHVSSEKRTWLYSYRTSNFVRPFWDGAAITKSVLSTVTQPDGRPWTFNLDGMLAEPGPGDCSSNQQTLTIDHPYGVTGTFVLQEKRHRQGMNTQMVRVLECPDLEPTYGTAPPEYVNALVDTMSVVSKNLVGPGIQPSTWQFAYEFDNTNAQSGLTNWTLVTEPGDTRIKYFHYWQEGPLGGKLQKKEVLQSSGSSPIETTVYDYDPENLVGNSFSAIGPTSGSLRARINSTKTTITRDGDVFTTENFYNSAFGNSYGHGFPYRSEEWGSTAGGSGNKRIAETTYEHNTTKWILGLTKTVKRGGSSATPVEFDRYDYDSNGRPESVYKFGDLVRTITYNSDGTVATSTDSNGHTYMLSDWKRGQPETVDRPDFTTFRRVVDANGWVKREIDAKGNTIIFDYNQVGWLKFVDAPSPFNNTNIVYTISGSGVTENRLRGATRTLTTYDSMLRPTLVKTEATNGTASTIYERMEHDIFGRTTFASLPSSSSTESRGTKTTYDALSRPLTTTEFISGDEQYTATTEYLSGGRTRVTDPSQNVSTTTARAFGSPQSPETISVTDPMNTVTTMDRDIYGNILTLSQNGSNPIPASVTRRFWYDAKQRMCRHRAPEFGDEVFIYDDENLLTFSGRGVPQASGCLTNLSQIPVADRVGYEYDELRRQTVVDFPSGTADIIKRYDDNGNLKHIEREESSIWTYQHNALDQITQEKLVHDDGRTYQFDYVYNNNGDLVSRKRNGGPTVSYDPDAFGRPRSARVGSNDYIHDISYHPTGSMHEADYGNGLEHRMTLDNRQKIQRIQVGDNIAGSSFLLNLLYGYDDNGRVDRISNFITSAETRFYNYDANGRLLTAIGPWGPTGTYTYDALSNIRAKTLGSETTVTVNYDAAKNQVTSADIDGVTKAYAYDARGNATTVGDFTFDYDFSNQPVSYTATTNSGAGTTQSQGSCTGSSSLTIANATDDGSHEAGRGPDKAHDGVIANNARWSAHGIGREITFDLGATSTVKGVRLAWYRGDVRQYTFDVQTSTDGSSFQTVLSNAQSSGTTTALETVNFTDTPAQQVRIIAKGSNANSWNSLLEVEVLGCTGGNTGGNTGGDTGKLTISEATDDGSHEAGRGPDKAIDGVIANNARWSAHGIGREITFDLGSEKSVGALKIAWYRGDVRQYTFDVEASSDNTNYQMVAYNLQSSGTTTDLETFDVPTTDARYIRVIAKGSNVSSWNSILEAEIHGSGGGATPTTVAGSFVYDGNLKRVKSVIDGPDGVKTTYSVYSAVTGGVIFREEVTDGKKWDYLSAANASVRLVNGGSPEYTHANHLGSPLLATDASGTVLWRESYNPFGGTRLNPEANDNNTGYTGHIHDTALGLTYMQARYYDPVIGRFLSTDPIGYQDQLNLYAYVANDPVNNFDPNGEFLIKLNGNFARFFPIGGGAASGVAIGHKKGGGIGFRTFQTGSVGAGIGIDVSIGGSVCPGCTLDDVAGPSVTFSAKRIGGIELSVPFERLNEGCGHGQPCGGAQLKKSSIGISFGLSSEVSATVDATRAGKVRDIPFLGKSGSKNKNGRSGSSPQSSNTFGPTFSNESVKVTSNGDGTRTATLSRSGSRLTRKIDLE